jgi:hypothetical protein
MWKTTLRIVAGTNLLFIPLWVLVFFGAASLTASSSDGYTFLYLVPAHIMLSIYSLVHHRFVSLAWVRDLLAVVLTFQQVLPPESLSMSYCGPHPGHCASLKSDQWGIGKNRGSEQDSMGCGAVRTCCFDADFTVRRQLVDAA